MLREKTSRTNTHFSTGQGLNVNKPMNLKKVTGCIVLSQQGRNNQLVIQSRTIGTFTESDTPFRWFSSIRTLVHWPLVSLFKNKIHRELVSILWLWSTGRHRFPVYLKKKYTSGQCTKVPYRWKPTQCHITHCKVTIIIRLDLKPIVVPYDHFSHWESGGLRFRVCWAVEHI